MTGKSVYNALALLVAVVLAAGMVIGTAGVVLADSEGAGYGTMGSSFSSEPEKAVEPSEAGEIREPMETGAVPDRPESSSDLYSNPSGDEATSSPGWSLFRPDIEGSP